jgi:ATP-dependent RNA circularization protein (DNA/RNA ligase family)
MNQIKTGAGGELYSNSEADRLSENYGLDVVDELTKILSEQLAKEIDKEILKGLGLEARNKRRKNSIDKIFKSSE